MSKENEAVTNLILNLLVGHMTYGQVYNLIDQSAFDTLNPGNNKYHGLRSVAESLTEKLLCSAVEADKQTEFTFEKNSNNLESKLIEIAETRALDGVSVKETKPKTTGELAHDAIQKMVESGQYTKEVGDALLKEVDGFVKVAPVVETKIELTEEQKMTPAEAQNLITTTLGEK